MIKKQKGISEVIAESIIILVIVALVGVVITVLVPAISKLQSQQRFEIAQDNIKKIDAAIIQVLNEPSGSVVEVGLNLDKQIFSIEQNQEEEIKILKISHVIKGNYFDDGIEEIIDSTKYNYREGQIVYSVLEYDNISFLKEIEIKNVKQIKANIKKIDAYTVEIYFYVTEH